MVTTDRNADTKQLTHTAFWSILSAGQPPTIDMVLDWMVKHDHGRRNRNVISETIKECWSITGARINEANIIPGIPEESVNLFIALRAHLHDVARAEYEQSMVEMQQHADSQVEAAQAEVLKLSELLERARSELRIHEDRYERLTSDLTMLKDQLLSNQSELAQANMAIARLNQTVHELESARAAIDHDMRASEATHKETLAREEQRFALLQRTLQQRADDEKTRANKLVTQIEGLSRDAHVFRTEAVAREREMGKVHAALSVELGRAKGQVEMLTDQLNSAHLAAQERTEEVAVAKSNCALLSAEVERLTKYIEQPPRKADPDRQVQPRSAGRRKNKVE